MRLFCPNRVFLLVLCSLVIHSIALTNEERQNAFIGYSEKTTSESSKASVPLETRPKQRTFDAEYRAPDMSKFKAGPHFANDADIEAWNEAVRRHEANSTEPVMVSRSPCVLLFPNFVSEEEADQSIAHALPRLRSQRFADQPESRTSFGATFGAGFAAPIIDRANRAIGTKRSDGLEVKRYRAGEKYQSHHDYFSQPGRPMKGDRVATFLVYLQDAELGGETMFPWRGGTEPIDPATGWPRRPLVFERECEEGYQPENALKLPVQKGAAVLFYSLTPDGEVDPYSQHGSCPVQEGEKWTATIWTRANDRFETDTSIEEWKANKYLQMCYSDQGQAISTE